LRHDKSRSNHATQKQTHPNELVTHQTSMLPVCFT
jgi:hypothetical protein